MAECFGIHAEQFLKKQRVSESPSVPEDYAIQSLEQIHIVRDTDRIPVQSSLLVTAINAAHTMVDNLYSVDLDIASVLGMRNLSAFIGELVAAAVLKLSNGQFERNPHQDGYPDLLLMDAVGLQAWESLHDRRQDKLPFSPFVGGGLEVKATCGSVPTPEVCRRRGIEKPDIGDRRIGCMTGYDWKAHHRETNNMLGVLWDFIDSRPRVVALFYSSILAESDWGTIVQPKSGGGRTTSVSIMSRSGIKKMYDGWLCVLASGGYIEFLNQRNASDSIPPGRLEKSDP